MVYFHIHVLTENNEYYEYDQTARSVGKLSKLYLKGHHFLINGLEMNPDEVRKIRVFRTDKPNKEILGSRVWDIGVDVTREFIDKPQNSASKSGTGFRADTGFRGFVRILPNYHVIISLKNRKKDAIAVNLREEELLDNVIKPFKEGSKFGLGNELISPEEIKRIKIIETEHFVTADKYGDKWNEANCGKEVTSKYLPASIVEAREAPKNITLKNGKLMSNSKIFIVHGKDGKPVKELKELLVEFGLKPIILHEQPSGSRTIVEKLEKYSDVGYAFVILTPDDRGCETKSGSIPWPMPISPQVKSEQLMLLYLQTHRPRARQNVVLEFGFFIGRLGRDKVCCLLKENVEKPSDMDGIVYVPFLDSVKEVREKIIRELEAAGYKMKTGSA